MARVAKSLDKLLAQLNTLFPNRSKVSDGAFGDKAHSKRKSDHNPNSAGVVTARDFTFDTNPADGVGIDCHKLASALFNSRDPRIKYIIWNRRITTPDKKGWKAYTGPNPHNHHLHLSVSSDPKLYDDDSEWKLDFAAHAQVVTEKTHPTSSHTELARGAKGEAVRKLQEKLFEMGYLKSSDIDGAFGIRTQSALQRFQKDSGLIADGIFGPKSAAKLGL